MNEPKDNPIVQRMFESAPLIRYSVYTHVQCQCLDALEHELHTTLDASFTPTPDGTSPLSIDASHFTRASGHFWLWMLGAYEVVRTMCQTPDCFSPQLLGRLRELKRLLAAVRMPFAKQELAGSQEPVAAEPSVSGVRGPPADLAFRIRGRDYTVRQLTSRWRQVFASIAPADVLADRRVYYGDRRR
jgi:hypothetical protein